MALAAALRFLEEAGHAAVRAHELELVRHAMQALAAIDGVRVLGDPDPDHRIGALSLTIDGVPHEMHAMDGYVIPGGVEHSAYCGPDGALVIDIFRPVREDYRERWQALG